MSSSRRVSRRTFLQSAALASAASVVRFSGSALVYAAEAPATGPLEEFGYGDVSLDSPLHEEQLRETHAVLMGLSEDALL